MTILLKDATVDTTNLSSEELLCMYFYLYYVDSIRGFTSIIDVLCEKTRIVCIFPTASKRFPVTNVQFILTSLNNQNHLCRHVRVDDYGDF